MLVLGINEMVSCLSSEILKDCSLFFIYKTNNFVKLLKFNANMIAFFVIYFCVIWSFSSSRKHLLYIYICVCVWGGGPR